MLFCLRGSGWRGYSKELVRSWLLGGMRRGGGFLMSGEGCRGGSVGLRLGRRRHGCRGFGVLLKGCFSDFLDDIRYGILDDICYGFVDGFRSDFRSGFLGDEDWSRLVRAVPVAVQPQHKRRDAEEQHGSSSSERDAPCRGTSTALLRLSVGEQAVLTHRLQHILLQRCRSLRSYSGSQLFHIFISHFHFPFPTFHFSFFSFHFRETRLVASIFLSFSIA